MAESKSKFLTQNTGITLVITYFVLFAVNALVVKLANIFFPYYVVLGTLHITKCWAIIHSMGTLALINAFAVPFVREYEKKKNKMLTNKNWMILYFVINFIGIWVLTRFSHQMGLGIRSWVVALTLAIILDVVQGIAMMQVEKFRKK